MKTLRQLFLIVYLATAARAGSISTSPWTGDADTGIISGQTVWAYHFGDAGSANINGVTVPGLASALPVNPTASAGQFSLAGPDSIVNPDSNNLTALTGTSSAILGRTFIYNAFPATLTLQGLSPGTTYTVTVLSVGWEAVGGRLVTFSSGTDSLVVDQDQFGDNQGIRVDYTFTATAATQALTVSPQGAGSFHFYGLALRPETAPTTVTNAANTGPGSLRWALANAADITGANTITFSAALNGQTITLTGGEITIADASGAVTVDATALSSGVTLSGGGTQRLFNVNPSRTLTLRGLTLTGGNGNGQTTAGTGGAISNGGTLTLTECTLTGNSATGAGGAIVNGTAANLSLSLCALHNNQGSYGGAISNRATVTLTHCTLAQNTATSGGGAIDNNPFSPFTLTHCTVSGNTAATGGGVDNLGALIVNNTIIAGNTATTNGPDVFNETSSVLTRQGASIVPMLLNNGTVNGAGSLSTANPRLAPLAQNGGRTRTMALLPGSPAIDAAAVVAGLTTDQRGMVLGRDGDRNGTALPDIGSYEAQRAPFSVGFNFTGGGPGGTLAAGDLAGLFPQASWNNLTTDYDGTGTGSYTNGPIPLLEGNASPLSPNLQLWWDAPNVWSISSTAPTTPDAKLMNGYLDSNNGTNSGPNLYAAQNQPFFAIAGLAPAITAAGYKVIVYVDGDATDGRLGSYWLTTNLSGTPGDVSGETDLTQHIFVRDAANFSGSFVPVPLTSTANLGAATPAGNCIIFSGLTAPGFIVRSEEGSFRAPLNAVQIICEETALVVTTSADENDPVGTPGTGLSLREAIRDAADGERILFANALSGQTITLGATGELQITKSVIVDASPLTTAVTVSGGGARRLCTVNPGKIVTLKNLILTGGNGNGQTTAGAGGAISNAGNLTLTQCTLVSNSATGAGGAILNSNGGTLSLSRCSLSNNHGGYGGAISNNFSATLSQCTLAGNTATSGGGAIDNNPFSPVTLTHCTISNNTAATGGGVDNLGALILHNTIIAGNTATTNGADLFNEASSVLTRQGVSLVPVLVNNGTVNGTGSLATTAPLLAPLGSNGGPTQTMPPLAGSPAINAAVALLTALTTDQRGLPIVGTPDIGAAERQLATVVTNTADSGDGSLRSAVLDAASIAGANTVTFDLALSGAVTTFTAGNGSIQVTDTAALTIDASALPSGIALNGGGVTQLFVLPVSNTLTLTGLTLTNGYNDYDGGAIFNVGTLTLNRCTLSGNRLGSLGSLGGGAIINYSGGNLTLNQCTLSQNNSGNKQAGAIRNDTGCTLALNHCTVSGNTAGANGGGIYNINGTLTLTNTIVAGNTATGSGQDLYNLRISPNTTSYTRVGANLVPSVASAGTITQSGPAAITAAPLLAPLGNYGGPTQTMALLPGSPARNAAAVLSPAITTDQRGFAIVGQPDIGAYEAGTLAPNFNAFIYETLPAAASSPQHAATFDFDGDGATNTQEWAALTDPASSVSVFRITSAVRTGGNFVISFPSVSGRTYTLWRSDTLGGWTNTGQAAVTGDGSVKTFTIPAPVIGIPKRFHRVQVGP